jgi:Fe-S cluster assembly iron-binding protein IscA
MLEITDTAAGVLRDVLAQTATPAGSGLRLIVNDDTPGEPGFQLSLVDGPAPGDRVAAADPPVFVAAAAIGALRDQVLDAGAAGDPLSLRVVPRAA